MTDIINSEKNVIQENFSIICQLYLAANWFYVYQQKNE